ncbi:MAG: LacI family DNA-binding transcriptional regulator [Chthoniobacterales bacterium]
MNIVEVARKAGASTATVSRVINGRTNVSEKMRERIFKAMQEIGYEPRHPSLRPGPRMRAKFGITRNTVALLMIGTDQVPTHGNVFGSLLYGVEQMLAANDLDLNVAQIDEHGRLPTAMERKHLDGLLLFGKMPDAKVRRKLRAFPCVWLLGVFEQTASEWGDHVTCDNAAIGRMAASHLLEQGHEHLAFINLTSNHPDNPARGKAFQSTVKKAGKKAVLLQKSGGSSFPSVDELDTVIHSVVSDFVRLKPRPTGVFCAGDLSTALFYRELQIQGLRPGHDVEIVSCNNEKAYLAGLYPRPATIDIGSEDVGRRGVEQLLSRLERPNSPMGEIIHVPPRLIPGENFSPSAKKR